MSESRGWQFVNLNAVRKIWAEYFKRLLNIEEDRVPGTVIVERER